MIWRYQIVLKPTNEAALYECYKKRLKNLKISDVRALIDAGHHVELNRGEIIPADLWRHEK